MDKNRSLHTGVEVRSNGTVRVRIKIDGRWKWQKTTFAPTSAGTKAAARLFREIKALNAIGAFDPADFFEEYKHASVDLFSIIAERYLRHRAADVSPSTYRGYRIRLSGIWCPAFGHMPVADIRRSDILDVCAAFNWQSGKTYRNALTPLKGVLDLALSDGLINSNPATLIKAPKTARPPVDPLTASEMRAVLNWFESEHSDWLSYFEFAFATGLRTSELIALHGDQIDDKQVTVFRSKVEGRIRQTTKTGVVRSVPLNAMAKRAISRLSVSSSKPLFLNPATDKAIASDVAPRKAWTSCLSVLKIRHRKAYSTRHTFATLHLQAGTNLVQISRWLGHSSVKMTEDHYAKWLIDTPPDIDALS